MEKIINNQGKMNKDQKTKDDFGKMIRKWRLKRKYGLRDFAILIGISPRDLSRIEDPDFDLKFQDLKKIIAAIRDKRKTK